MTNAICRYSTGSIKSLGVGLGVRGDVEATGTCYYQMSQEEVLPMQGQPIWVATRRWEVQCRSIRNVRVVPGSRILYKWYKNGGRTGTMVTVLIGYPT